MTHKNNQLVGHWRCKSKSHVCDWTLRADGTFEASVTGRGVQVSLSHGSWKIEGRDLVAIYTEDKFGMIPPGLSAKDLLVEITDDYFVIETRHGTSERYERVH